MTEYMPLKVGDGSITKYLTVLINHDQVTLLARGTHIKKCVDLAVIAARDRSYAIDDVRIFDSEYKGEDRATHHVSNIEIDLHRQIE